ncbi:MAG: hypothetical protein HXX17_07420 [Geobacteraceae bacterium]|nr:hypothetical protein [Geobacteraceae bacterium]
MSYLRITVMALFVAAVLGCAAKEKAYWNVTDSDEYWKRSGFSIKPPSGSNWIKQPLDDKYPNSIAFVKGEGWSLSRVTVTFKGTAAVATSTILDEPVQNRKDVNLLTTALRNHLTRYQMYLQTKITGSDYDSSLGLDCLKYSGAPKTERFKTNIGDMSQKIISGYFCLHPTKDDFGVIMESHDFAMVYTDVTKRNDQVDHFFGGLRFDSISTAASRTFKAATYQVGKAPSQLALLQNKLWVALKDEDRVIQVDPADGKTLVSIAVGKQPAAVAVGEKGVWIANSGDGTVTRIDPFSSEVVQVIPVGGKPVSISVGQGQVWVADTASNAVIRIDPATNGVTAKIAVGPEPVSVIAGNDGIWTANAGNGTVSIIDKAYDLVTGTISVGGRPVHISLADTGAWVADERGKEVVRIDRKRKTVAARIDVGGSSVWIQAYSGWDLFVALADSAKIVRIDPKLGRVFGPPIQSEASPRSMILHAGSIWFTNSGGTTLTRVNLDPNGQAFGSHPGGAI